MREMWSEGQAPQGSPVCSDCSGGGCSTRTGSSRGGAGAPPWLPAAAGSAGGAGAVPWGVYQM